ncbi:hypothetical protein Tco_1497673, partial [Tanacetum coccineum]
MNTAYWDSGYGVLRFWDWIRRICMSDTTYWDFGEARGWIRRICMSNAAYWDFGEARA